MTLIELKQQHTDFTDPLARRRMDAAVERNRQPNNNAPANDTEEAFALVVMGTRCECAAYLWAKPVKWHTFADDVRDLPDLHDFINVKGTSRSTDSLLVKSDEPDHWAYLLVLPWPRHPLYRIRGWLWGHEAKQVQWWRDPVGDRPAYFVPQLELRGPEELLIFLRMRQEGRP